MKHLILFADDECSMRFACKAIEGKWKLPVIYVLSANGTLRYNELKKCLGITNVMLSNTLKEMEAEGLVLRTQYNEIPPRVEYSLTTISMKLVPVVEAFSRWGLAWKDEQQQRLDASEADHDDDKAAPAPAPAAAKTSAPKN